MELVEDFEPTTSGTQKVGFRFNNITVPQGATITNAYLTFRAVSADSPNDNTSATNLLIKAQASDNAPAFPSTDYYFTNATKTAAGTNWSPSAWTTGVDYNSSAINNVVQEITSRTGWSSGNSMAFIITGTGSRSASSWDYSGVPAQLTIEYALPAGEVLIETTTTNASGAYAFTGLGVGDYFVEFILPANYTFSPQDQGGNDVLDSDANTATGKTEVTTLIGGENDITWDAGMYYSGPLGTIGDYVWYDANHDGLQNDGGGAAGLENVKLTLFDGTNTAIDITYTDNNGWYEFTGLVADDYTVLLDNTTLPPVLVHATYDYDGTDSQHFAHLTLAEGETNNQIDFGYSDQPLPVTLASFRVEKETKGVVIKWITESEIENQGFVIERKENSSSEWIEIANYITNFELKGQGTVTYSTEYEYLDKLVYPGNTYEYRLGDIDYNGVVTYHATEMITINLSDKIGTPEAFSVKPAYPNPFNPSTVIEYGLPEIGQVNVTIYDILGHSIKTLVNQNQTAGWHSITWNGYNDNGSIVPAGLYLGVINTQKNKQTIKLMYVK
jgi:hypothetical protein